MSTRTKEAEQNALKAGYVKNPNNIYGIPGSEWYAGAGNIPEFPNAIVYIQETDLQKYREHIEAIVPAGHNLPQNYYPIGVYHHVYGNGTKLSLFRRYKTWEDFYQAAIEFGTLSKPGMPAYIFGN